jgi:hypothetical protein
MLKRFSATLGLAAALAAQEPVAPTPEQAGTVRGENAGLYNVTDSFETGYRWALIGGNLGKYRSDVNYGNGIRLLGSSLAVHSREGHGRWFDEILLNTTGLGNDPYQAATLRVERNGLYRYDLLWRLNEYYNPGLTTSGGLHLMDTRRRLQDHDLTLLPQKPVQLHLGYSRDTQTGPALSSVQEFDSSGPAFPLFTDVRRQWNEYRLGADVSLAGWRFSFLRRWDYYKDDSPYNTTSAILGNGAPPVLLTQFRRSEPYHGSSPGWLGNLTTARKRWAANARIAYNSGSRDFALNESVAGAQIPGAAVNRQIFVGGNARRPVTSGDLNLSFFPGERLTIVNNTSVHSTRIDGDSSYNEFNNGSGSGVTLDFRYLGVRTVSNSTDVNYRAAAWMSVYGGYHYSDRLIRYVQAFSGAGAAGRAEYHQTGILHAGTAGVRLQPLKPLTLNLEGEIGRANRPFTPVSERHYHTLGGRAAYRTRNVQLSAQYRQAYNLNAPLSFAAFNSHARNASASASWTPAPWLSLDASYSKLHLNTASGLAFFAGAGVSQLQQGYSSIYISNIHTGNLGARFTLLSRADLYIGYVITRDAGDGRATATLAGTTDPVQALLASVQTFPLSYQTPMARISIRIAPKLRWNAGWQFYDYSEDFHLFGYAQNYRAHTGYSSVSWSF